MTKSSRLILSNEDKLIQEEKERLRKLRIIQVREISKQNAAQLRNAFKKEQDDIDETSFSKNDDFEMIDYVLVYQKYSDRRLQEYRNIYLKNLVTFGLKLRNVLLKYFINIFSLFKLFLLLIK